MSIVFGCVAPHPPVLLPEVGGSDARLVSRTAEGFHALARQLHTIRPDVAVLISPHGVAHADAMGVVASTNLVGDFRMFRAGDLSVRCRNDLDLAAAIHQEAIQLSVPCRISHEPFYQLDHGSLVPLHFLRLALAGVPVIPLTFCKLAHSTHHIFGQAIQTAAEKSGKRVAFIASGDLSHRLSPGAPAGYDPLGKVFDENLVELIRQGNGDAILSLDHDLIHRAGQCGLNSIAVLLGALSGLNWTSQIISYEGPFGVGYLVASFTVATGSTAADSFTVRSTEPVSQLLTGMPEIHPLLKLARDTVEQYVVDGTKLLLDALSPELCERAGVFVSIYKSGNLRGCVGTIEPVCANVAEEAIANAISSATRDPRFSPVEPHELPLLSYSIDVISRPEPIDGLESLDPRRYGVIVECGLRRGLLLPDLKGVDTPHEQVDIARRKAGILPGAAVALYRFTVRRFSER
ncbi:MAG: AmmeMemoRadiSam system protein A [Chloroflexota bacterium]|nr:MAG: AmmeMemoRadiSam system protein A [Chloroflexota bacterium]